MAVAVLDGLPDRIIVYRQAICTTCRIMQEVADPARGIVIHEIAYYFGIDYLWFREPRC